MMDNIAQCLKLLNILSFSIKHFIKMNNLDIPRFHSVCFYLTNYLLTFILPIEHI